MQPGGDVYKCLLPDLVPTSTVLGDGSRCPEIEDFGAAGDTGGQLDSGVDDAAGAGDVEMVPRREFLQRRGLPLWLDKQNATVVIKQRELEIQADEEGIAINKLSGAASLHAASVVSENLENGEMNEKSNWVSWHIGDRGFALIVRGACWRNRKGRYAA